MQIEHRQLPLIALISRTRLSAISQQLSIGRIERSFVGGWDDGNIACAIRAGLGVHREEHLFVGRADQCIVEVGLGGNGCAVDGEDVIPRLNIETDGSKWRTGVFVPIFAGQNAIDPVGVRSWIARKFGAE